MSLAIYRYGGPIRTFCDMMELVQRMLKGERRALSQLVTLLERDIQDRSEIMRAIYPYTGQAYCIGVTGLPGAGKSTIVDGLVGVLRGHGVSVGVLAVDPTSPFSGGAVLGDRIRMRRHYLDKGVFIRSLATRGVRGGLSSVSGASVKLMDAFGNQVVILETVGVGQTELDVMNIADTVVVTLMPEAGDAIQAMKAGLTEVADVFVVNKSDRDGAAWLASAVEATLRLGVGESLWRPPVLLTQARNGEGIEELYDLILKHRRAMEETSQLDLRRQRRQKREFDAVLKEAAGARISALVSGDEALSQIAALVETGDLDPYTAVAQVLDNDSVFPRSGKTKPRVDSTLPP